jgi:hypothetical protein
MSDTHDTRETMPKRQSPPRRPAPDEVLHARPVKGEIDYAELIRDTIARFPKILDALAKR